MKKPLIFTLVVLILLSGCSPTATSSQPVTTIPDTQQQKPTQTHVIPSSLTDTDTLSAAETIPITQTPFPLPTLSPTQAHTETASPSLLTSTTGQTMDRSVRITIIYDNYLWDQRLTPEWGFGALVEVGEYTILFDTGGSGETFLNNLDILEIDPKNIQAVVISHAHGDHFGGLLDFLEIADKPRVYLPSGFSSSLKTRVSGMTETVEGSESLEIAPGIYTTGTLHGDGVAEQGLVIDLGSKVVILTGCAHPGVVQMVRSGIRVAASHSSGVTKPVALVVGGFHLREARSSQVQSIITDFKNAGVMAVSPTHCTGDATIAIFAEHYGESYLPGGAGQVFELP